MARNNSTQITEAPVTQVAAGKYDTLLASGTLSLQDVAILLAADAKQARKAAARDTVNKVLTREQFLEEAQPFEATLHLPTGDVKVLVNVAGQNPLKSLGWNANGQTKVEVCGKQMSCTLGINLTVNHTKPAK